MQIGSVFRLLSPTKLLAKTVLLRKRVERPKPRSRDTEIIVLHFNVHLFVFYSIHVACGLVAQKREKPILTCAWQLPRLSFLFLKNIVLVVHSKYSRESSEALRFGSDYVRIHNFMIGKILKCKISIKQTLKST